MLALRSRGRKDEPFEIQPLAVAATTLFLHPPGQPILRRSLGERAHEVTDFVLSGQSTFSGCAAPSIRCFGRQIPAARPDLPHGSEQKLGRNSSVKQLNRTLDGKNGVVPLNRRSPTTTRTLFRAQWKTKANAPGDVYPFYRSTASN